MDDTIFLIFVELNRFGKKDKECVSMMDKWMFALKHVGTLDRLPVSSRAQSRDLSILQSRMMGRSLDCARDDRSGDETQI